MAINVGDVYAWFNSLVYSSSEIAPDRLQLFLWSKLIEISGFIHYTWHWTRALFIDLVLVKSKDWDEKKVLVWARMMWDAAIIPVNSYQIRKICTWKEWGILGRQRTAFHIGPHFYVKSSSLFYKTKISSMASSASTTIWTLFHASKHALVHVSLQSIFASPYGASWMMFLPCKMVPLCPLMWMIPNAQ